MESVEARAYARFWEQVGNAALELSRELRGASGSDLGVAHVGLTWNERLLRQSLILADIADAGGTVTRDQWVEIAGRYGYAGRGLAGFFRSDGSGLLDMTGTKVKITPRGRARLKENRARVDAWRTAHEG